MTTGRRIRWFILGRMPYGDALALQRRLWQLRRANRVGDTVLFLEHNHVYTIGKAAGAAAHLLVDRQVLEQQGVELYEVERGGDITYHGPGQLVAYPIFDLRQYGRDVRQFVFDLEQLMIAFLQSYGLAAERREGARGVWTGGRKIGALGLAVRQWVTYHGLALNIAPDLKYFQQIVPCGLTDCRVTSLQQLLPSGVPSIAEAAVGMARLIPQVWPCRLERGEAHQLSWLCAPR